MKTFLKYYFFIGFIPAIVWFFLPSIFTGNGGIIGADWVISFLPTALKSSFLALGLTYTFIFSLIASLLFCLYHREKNLNFIVYLRVFLSSWVGSFSAYLVMVAIFIQALSNFSM
jgi:hypothetical protein